LGRIHDRPQDRSGLVVARSGDGPFHHVCDMVRTSKVIPLFGGGRQPIQTIHAGYFYAALLPLTGFDLDN